MYGVQSRARFQRASKGVARLACAIVVVSLFGVGVPMAGAAEPTAVAPPVEGNSLATAGSIEFVGGAGVEEPTAALAEFTGQAASGGFPLVSMPSTDYVSAGVGGLRGIGAGNITVAGVSGEVSHAFLFWQGPTNSEDSGANAHVQLDGVAVSGINVGFSSDNCWGFANSQAYRADVTGLFHGDGVYRVSGMVDGSTRADINGASIVVFFDNGNPADDRRVTVYNGNDSNIENSYDAEGWQVALSGIAYEAGPASIELHVSDGQTFSDDAVRVDDSVIVPGGAVFSGNTVPGGAGPAGNGNLWDIRTFDITAALTAGQVNDVLMTTGVVSDCLSAVVAIVSVRPNDMGVDFFHFVVDELFGQFPFFGFADDPVNTASGNFTHSATDLDSADVYGLTWGRTYNAQDDRASALGRGWTTVHDVAVLDEEAGTVTVRLHDGRRVRFASTGLGTWTRPEGFYGDLFRDGDGSYRIRTYDGQVWDFDTSGRLVRMDRWDGQWAVVTWGASGPEKVTSSTGRSLDPVYQAGRLVRVDASDGRSVAYQYDTNGRLSAAVDPAGGATGYAYDSDGLVAEIFDPAGVLVVRNTYDAQRRVVTQETAGRAVATFTYDDETGETTVEYLPSGERVTYRHDPEGRLVGIVDPTGGVVDMARQGDGELASATNRLGEQTTFTYDRDGNLLSETAPSSGTRSYTYDSLNRLTSVTEPFGATTRYGYEASERVPTTIADAAGGITRVDVVAGLVRSITDPDGVATRFGYDAGRQLVTAADGAGNATSYEYDPAGRVSAVTSAGGSRTQLTYDPAGRLLSTVDPLGGEETRTYDDAGHLRTVSDPGGAMTTYHYDGRGHLVGITDPRGETTTYDHDAYGAVVRSVAPGGAATTNEHGPLGRLHAVTDPLGRTSRYGHDAVGNVVATTDPTGATTDTAYDAAGRVTSVTDPLGRTTAWSYDDAGRPASVTDPAGAVTSYGYDGLGRRATVTDALGGVTTYSFTAGGRVAAVTDPVGGETRYAYDAAGRVSSVESPTSGSVDLEYDADGHLVAATSATGDKQTTDHDAAGQVVATTDAGGTTTTYDYDARGNPATVQVEGEGLRSFMWDDRNLLAITDALGNTTELSYDGRGNRTSATDALGRTMHTAFDAADQMTAVTDGLGRTATMAYDGAGRFADGADASGRQVSHSYDDAGQLTAQTFGDGTTVAYTYDEAGRRTSMTDASGTTTYEYDAAGRLVAVVAANGDRLAYRYDEAGRRTAMTYPDGTEVLSSYDASGRLLTVDHPVAGTSTYSYDGDGRLVGEDVAGGTSRQYTYDGGRLVSFTEDGSTTTLTYDAAGRLAGLSGDEDLQFSYDSGGQLIAAASGTATYAYTYDAVGNRVEAATPAGAQALLVDNGNQLVSADDGTRFEHDEAGRLSEVVRPDGARRSFSYDARGLLVQQVVTSSGGAPPDPPVDDGCASATPTITGTGGDDVITGTDGDDVIFALGGNDVVDARNGDDVVCGGDGNDDLTGGNGADSVSGGAGADMVRGGNGPDQVYGEAGDDTVEGGDGNDAVFGGADNDVLRGDNGDDDLDGGAGADQLAGGRGNDTLDGRSGVDALDGASGEDHCEREPARVGCEIDVVDPGTSQTTVLTRTYDGDRLLTHVTITRPGDVVDEYDLTWDRTGAVPQVVSLVHNGTRSDIVYGRRRAFAVTGVDVEAFSYDALGDAVGAAENRLTVDDRYGPYGEEAPTELTVGFGYRGELHVGDLVYLRHRDLDPSTGRFITVDPMGGVPGATTVLNQYHYAGNDPVNQQDPLGLRPSDGDIDAELAEPDRDLLADLGVVAAAGFPFHLFNPWHRAVRDDLAAKVGGRVECLIRGAGPTEAANSWGFADVCTATNLWEVKYFGETGLESAEEQLARYMRHDPRTPGRIVAPSTLQVGNWRVFAFSPSVGVRLYIPVPWLRVLSRDPVRSDIFEHAVPEQVRVDLAIEAGILQPAPQGGFGLPDIEVPDPPSWLSGVLAGGAGAIFLCIMFCIPTPWPVL